MATHTVILDSNLIERLSLIPENLKAAGFQEDSALDVSFEDGRIVLRPAHPIQALQGILASGPSLTDELIEERRRDDERSRQKSGW